MSVSEVNPSEHEVLRQRVIGLEAKNAKTKADNADIENMYIELLEAIREEYTRRFDGEETKVFNELTGRERRAFDALPDNNSKIVFIQAMVEKERTWREKSNLGDDLVKDMEITELALCPECNNSLFSDSLKALTLLECGYVYHRKKGTRGTGSKMDVDEEQNNDYDDGEIESTRPKKTGSASSSNKGKKRANEELNFALHICRGIANLSPWFECENIMVTESNLAKLANFGTSREKHDATTTIGSQPERVRWLAPEKLKDNGRRYDHKCEIFSFGMLLWELAFSKNPYENFEIDKISDHVIDGGREIFPTHGTIEVMKRSL
ncbi:hypothetical protein RhiirA4_456571 [Rhizophagus irregularis]|uniref:Protein kinase domain-containing protein n=1 Tax=Rhizophagus irregularis TaxID=588596 RepID=A0A2I1G7W4_9GLOM|nr:hypothetical protein RhiirA4_456571 [Rhizophagus irregularis]